MNQQFDKLQKQSKEGVDAALKSLGVFSKNAQAAANESATYAKKSFEQGTATIEKLINAKTPDTVLKIHTDYLTSSYEGLFAYVTKISDLMTSATKEAAKPFESVVANATSYKS